MYSLRFTDAYLAELAHIDGSTGLAHEVLQEAAYRILGQNPRVGERSVPTNIWRIRALVLQPLVGVHIWYRIEEETKTVVLISAQSTPLSPG